MTLARLQLAVGNAAVLQEELGSDGARRIFAARAPDEAADAPVSRLVVWHPSPPDGPHPGAVLDRMASIRALGHPALAAPLATGSIDEAAWVVEPAPLPASLASRLAVDGPLSHHELIRLLRETARALAAMHRRGICHGALSVDAITLHRDGVRLNRLGRRMDGTVAQDIAAFSALGRAVVASHSTQRGPQRLIPDGFRELLDRWDSDDRRPVSADQVLAELDSFPGAAPAKADSLFHDSDRSARQPGQRRAAMLMAAAAVVLLLVWLLLRAG